jgi:hypothetical protein
MRVAVRRERRSRTRGRRGRRPGSRGSQRTASERKDAWFTPPCCDRTEAKVSHLHSNRQRLTAHVDQGSTLAGAVERPLSTTPGYRGPMTGLPPWAERMVPTCQAVADLLHPHVEVVLHDLERDTIVRLWNGFSNRRPGDPSLLSELPGDPSRGSVLGPYEKVTADGRRLTSPSLSRTTRRTSPGCCASTWTGPRSTTSSTHWALWRRRQ